MNIKASFWCTSLYLKLNKNGNHTILMCIKFLCACVYTLSHLIKRQAFFWNGTESLAIALPMLRTPPCASWGRLLRTHYTPVIWHAGASTKITSNNDINFSATATPAVRPNIDCSTAINILKMCLYIFFIYWEWLVTLCQMYWNKTKRD